MLVANAVIGMADGLDRELAIRGGNRNKFAAGEFLRRATFVGIDMGGLGADHGMIGLRQRLQAQAVRSRAVEHNENFNIRTEVLLELADRSLGIRVVPVPHHMPPVDGGNGLQHLRMDAGIVIAGETADRFHGTNNVAEVQVPAHCPTKPVPASLGAR